MWIENGDNDENKRRKKNKTPNNLLGFEATPLDFFFGKNEIYTHTFIFWKSEEKNFISRSCGSKEKLQWMNEGMPFYWKQQYKMK